MDSVHKTAVLKVPNVVKVFRMAPETSTNSQESTDQEHLKVLQSNTIFFLLEKIPSVFLVKRHLAHLIPLNSVLMLAGTFSNAKFSFMTMLTENVIMNLPMLPMHQYVLKNSESVNGLICTNLQSTMVSPEKTTPMTDQ